MSKICIFMKTKSKHGIMYSNLDNCCFGELDYARDDFHLLVLTFKKCFEQACFNLKNIAVCMDTHLVVT